jgi:hypothetical protein
MKCENTSAESAIHFCEEFDTDCEQRRSLGANLNKR